MSALKTGAVAASRLARAAEMSAAATRPGVDVARSGGGV